MTNAQKILTQYTLCNRGKDGLSILTTWIDAKLEIGDEITMKNGPEGWWQVVRVFDSTTLKELDRKRKWNNNI